MKYRYLDPQLRGIHSFEDVETLEGPLRSAANAVYKLQTTTGVGTAFFISPHGVLVTNEHVLGKKQCYKHGCMATLIKGLEWGRVAKGQTLFFRPLLMKLDLDMVVYQVYEDPKGTKPFASPEYLKINPSFPYAPGKPLFLIGHPNGGLKKLSRGTYLSGDNLRSTWFQLSNFVLPGNSGSPILDENGWGSSTEKSPPDYQKPGFKVIPRALQSCPFSKACKRLISML